MTLRIVPANENAADVTELRDEIATNEARIRAFDERIGQLVAMRQILTDRVTEAKGELAALTGETVEAPF